mgnify:CR=1 FL=1
MSKRQLLMGCLTGAWILTAVPVWAGANEDASKAFTEGKALLAKGDFDGALKAYAEAAKADSDKKQEYRQQYAILRQVITMRSAVETEKNPQKSQAMIRALRSFYRQNSLHSEALALDKKAFAKSNSAESAAALAQTQLAMGMNREASQFLGGLDEKLLTSETRILLGIALARQKKIDAAKAALDKCKLEKDAQDYGLLYNMACAKALVGDHAGALDMLTQAFQATPPSRLDFLKADAKKDSDLAGLAGSAGFEKALKTESKVKESKCSGGSSCGNCPSRGSCSSGGAGSSRTSEKK